jgi:hypothetical protein
MPFDEYLADRIRNILGEKRVRFEEKRMMGGLAFMVNGKMCVGVLTSELMLRLSPTDCEELLQKKVAGIRPMDLTGKPLKGFLFAGGEAIDSDHQLGLLINMALAYNPFAKSSAKRKE